MRELSSTLEVAEMLARQRIDPRDFEAAYDSVARTNPRSEIRASLESRARSYFEVIEIPSEPTIYDKILLALRSKDLVATLNWDPLVAQAQERNQGMDGPQVVYLHGSTAFGLCLEDRRYGPRGQACGGCGKPRPDMPILYPVRDKDYRSNVFIANQWQLLEEYLRRAYYVTFFGYSAPRTDAAAREILIRSWRKSLSPNLSQIEFISPISEEAIRTAWADFLAEPKDAVHWVVVPTFEASSLHRNPRRTCEVLRALTLELKHWRPDPFPRVTGWGPLHRWIDRLRAKETGGPGSEIDDETTPLQP